MLTTITPTWLRPTKRKLKDVTMEEVEDVEAQDFNKFGDEMEFCNHDHTESVGRGGQTLMRHLESSQCPKLYYKLLVIFHFIWLLFLPMKLHISTPIHDLAFCMPHLHLIHIMWHNILCVVNMKKMSFWRLLHQCLILFSVSIRPLIMCPSSGWGSFPKVSSTLEGMSTRSTHGNMKDKK